MSGTNKEATNPLGDPLPTHSSESVRPPAAACSCGYVTVGVVLRVPSAREDAGCGLRSFGGRGRRGCDRLNRVVGGVERVGPVRVPARARGCGCDRALRVPPVCSPVTVSAASAAAAAEAASVVSGIPSVGVHA